VVVDFAFGLFGGLVVGFCAAFLFVGKVAGRAVGETLKSLGVRPSGERSVQDA
jgi:F0F1-type ATP synthase assembly protein I